MKTIAVVTGTRAEYGLLKPLMQNIVRDDELQLLLLVSGMHLSPEFGLTYHEIEADGFVIDEKVEMLLSSDSSVGICKSIGVGILGFAEAFSRHHIDIIILLGDRYETLSAAICAMIQRIPIAHLHGGELTEGLIDESIRHSITKMSYLHFTSTQDYRRRVIQLGENPARVFNVGAIGVENIQRIKLMSKEELEQSIDFKLDQAFAVVTYHPVTLENNTVEKQFKALLEALSERKDLKLIFTKANADTDGRIINELIDHYVNENRERACAFKSLGQLRYLSALKYCTLVIGNSSSGIIEVPSFHKPTVNIGDRQKGRVCAESVVHCGYSCDEIGRAIEYCLSERHENVCKNSHNPYEQAGTSDKIVEVVKQQINEGKIDLKKTFFDMKEISKCE